MSIDHIDVEKLSYDELIQLNHRIIGRIQYLQSMKTQAAIDRFQIGDKVYFQSSGRRIEGIVFRVNRKTLGVHTTDANWNIHPGMVSKITEQKPFVLDKIMGPGFSSKGN